MTRPFVILICFLTVNVVVSIAALAPNPTTMYRDSRVYFLTSKPCIVVRGGTADNRRDKYPSLQLFCSSQYQSSCKDGGGGDDDDDDDDDASLNSPSKKSGLEDELERLQHQLSFIEALEERNVAQLDSFVHEQDQWESMDEEDRTLLESKEETVQRLESLAEELVQGWMSGKMMAKLWMDR